VQSPSTVAQMSPHSLQPSPRLQHSQVISIGVDYALLLLKKYTHCTVYFTFLKSLGFLCII
jgi:hypothetical protein